MMYVNKLYPLKAANFTYQEGTKVTSSAQADGSTLISASGAFSFSTSTAKTYEIGASALNLSGVYFDKNQVPCDAWSGAKGVVAPPAPAAPPPMPDAGKKQPALIIQRQQIQIQQMLQQMQNQQQVMASKLGVSTKHDVIPASVINHLPAK